MAEKLEDKHVVLSPAHLADSINRKLEGYRAARNRDKPTIHKVHPDVRGEDNHDYDPKFVSIGPFHRRKDTRLDPAEQLKWWCLGDLVGRSPENTVQRYVDAVLAIEEKARGQYSEDVGLLQMEFVEMLVLDGCFIVELLVKTALGTVNQELPFAEVKWNLPLLKGDMLLLENQIPFFVLQDLFNCSRVPELEENRPRSLVFLALHYISKAKVQDLNFPKKCPPLPYHLLHLSHLLKMKGFAPNQPTNLNPSSCFSSAFRKAMSEFFVTVLYYVISLLLMWKPPGHHSLDLRNGRVPRMIPSATKLQEYGVTFRKKEGEDCLLNVSFTDDGTLEIPFLRVQQDTVSSLRNLIAFEQCCPKVNDYSVGDYFTAYAVFMDNLIDTPEDVAVLVEHGIVESKLGSAEEAAQLFNGLRRGTSLSYDKHYLADVFKKVKDYCESDRHRWRAQLVRGYFSNPWARISFIAGFLILVFTTLQTVYTVVGYHLPKK